MARHRGSVAAGHRQMHADTAGRLLGSQARISEAPRRG
jgi:hypothetical protein